MSSPAQNPLRFLTHHEILTKLEKEIAPVNFDDIIGLSPKKIEKKHYLVESVAKTLSYATDQKFHFSKKDGMLYLYNGAFWKKIEKCRIEHFLGNSATTMGLDKYHAEYHQFRSEQVLQLLSKVPLIQLDDDSEDVMINLVNGTFVINTQKQEIKRFHPKDFLTYQLSFPFEKEAKCEQFIKFLDHVLPDKDQQNILAEYLGYIFIKQKTLKLEKCLVLYGTGANGKSVFFDIVKALLGSHNVSSFSLQSLTNESGYQRAKLGSKLLNYSSEMSTHMNSSFFKQLASGEPVEARLPYGDPFIIENYAKFIFNANELPRDVEQNDAFFRRFILIHFAVTIPNEQRDPKLAQKLIENELPGIFNWVLEGLKRLLEQKAFTNSEVMNDDLKEYRESSDSVRMFLTDEKFITSNNIEMALKDFYQNYREYAIDSGHKPTTKVVFSRRLKTLEFSHRRKNTGMMVGVEKELI